MKRTIFLMLLVYGIVHSAKSQNAIFEAIRNGDQSSFMQLVQDPKNVNLKVEAMEGNWKYIDYTPLMCAVLYEKEEMVLELLKRKAKVNAKCKIPEGYEIDKCEAKVSNYTPLLMAAAKGNVNIIKLLLRAKANTQDKVKIKFRSQKCYKSGSWYVTQIELGPQGYAELFKHEDASRVIRTAKGSSWIKEPIK